MENSPSKWQSKSTEIKQEMHFLRFFGTLAILTIIFVLVVRFVQQTSSIATDRPQAQPVVESGR